MINRDQAYTLIKKYLKDEDNIKYSIAVENILKKMAELLERDVDLWGLTGLLHNLDYEYCAGSPETRGSLASQLLEGLLPDAGVNAIKANNYMHTDYIPTTSLDKSLIAAVTAAGFIITVTKSLPSKKIKDAELSLVLVKFHDSTFAQRYNRNRIYICEDLGMQLDFFLDLCLSCLTEISDDIGL